MKPLSKIRSLILIFLFSIPVFYFSVYRLLVDKIGIGYAYSLDQFLPFIVTIILAFTATKKQLALSFTKKYLKKNGLSILLIITTILLVHGWVLGNYFFGEEPNSILRPINIGEVETPLDLRGWHLGPYVLSYQLFSTNVIYYNVIALLIFIVTAIIFYIFLNLLFDKKVAPSLIGTLFFVTTPSYMDMFTWQFHFSGMPLALSAGLLSIIYLLIYQRSKKYYFYLISLLFYLSMLKVSFNRFHAFIALPLFICLFSSILSPKLITIDVKRFIKMAVPFVIILLSYLLVVFILPDSIFVKAFPSLFPKSEFAGADITFARKTFSLDGYLIILSLLAAYLFIPSQFAEKYFPIIRGYLSEISFATANVSLTFFLGVSIIILLIIVGLIALLNVKRNWGRLLLFSVVSIFANIVFIPILIKGYSDLTALDQRISMIGPGNGPGIRYVFVSSIGLSMLLATIIFWLSKYKNVKKIFICFILIVIIYYSGLNILSHINTLKEIHPSKSALPNSIFSTIPRDGTMKLLYSANPEKNTIDSSIGDWLYAFYKPEELIYTNSFEEAKSLIQSKGIKRDNIYAFYNNPLTHTFKDISHQARVEFFDNKTSIEKLSLIENNKLSTTYTETGSPIFPYVLNRWFFISGDFNQQLFSPRKLSITIEKRKLPVRFPYVDGLIVGTDYQDQFPRSVLNTLSNEPLVFSIRQMNLAFSVKSLKNRLISELSPETRLNIAKESVMREASGKVILTDVEKINKHYFDNLEILQTFLESPSFNTLGLIYACAENDDWQQQERSLQKIGGIWFSQEFTLNESLLNEEFIISISCFGSKLRQIILIGPPIPSTATLNVVIY